MMSMLPLNGYIQLSCGRLDMMSISFVNETTGACLLEEEEEYRVQLNCKPLQFSYVGYFLFRVGS